MSKYYLQINPIDSVITDCLVNPHGNYVEFNDEVPSDILCGAYKLEEGKIVEYPDLRPVMKDDEIEQLKFQNEELTLATLDLADTVARQDAQLQEQSEALLDLANTLAEVMG